MITYMKKIGIVVAMKEELEAVEKFLKNIEEKEIRGTSFKIGIIGKCKCVVVHCGIGKVNASICAQILVDDFHIDYLINTGVAGSLNNDMDICDIVISRKAIQHDFNTGTLDDCDPGEIPNIGTKFFDADDRMIEKATRSAQRLNLGVKVIEGIIATGDQFISDKDVKDYLVEEFDADCCEMEGASIAQVAYLNDVPFVILRAISDKADGSARMSFDDFVSKAAEHSMQLVKEMVVSL